MTCIKELHDAAQKVMDDLGSYHKEQVYEEAIMHEFRCCSIPYERQRNIEIIYKGYTIGMRRPDCILNPLWSENEGEELLVEMKALKKIGAQHKKQAEVYLISMGIDKGVVLNFKKGKNEVEILQVQNPGKEFEKSVVKPTEPSEADIEKVLKQAGEEVLNYLGPEFFYHDKGVDLYIEAVGVELRLRGLDFSSATHPVLYRDHHVTDYLYDYVFSNGEVVKIFTYKKESEIDSQKAEFRFYKERFGIKEGISLFFPKEENKEQAGVVVERL